jgi:hypothetical protein
MQAAAPMCLLTGYFVTITIRVTLSTDRKDEAGMSETKQTSGQKPPLAVEPARGTERGLLFERVSFESQAIKLKDYIQCRFEDAYFKEAQFHHCDFYHTRFVNCYFRGASFSGTNFRGCLFDSCNFEGAKFHDCDLEYSEFSNSRIKYGQLSGCFPKWPNVLLRFARSLRKNAESLGDREEHRKFLFLELQASELHDLNVFTKYDNYYQKYTFVERVGALKRWVLTWIERLVWGHGEKWSRVIWTAVVIACFFAVLLRFTDARFQNMPNQTFWNLLGISVGNMVGANYVTIAPANTWARVVLLSERASGLVVFGFLIASLYRRISKR